MTNQVVSYSSQRDSVSLTKTQVEKLVEAKIWPKDSAGQEMSDVQFGLHNGVPSLNPARFARLLDGEHFTDLNAEQWGE